MRKISLLMLSFVPGIMYVHAQNTFPANGRAGIYTTSPAASLHVNGGARIGRGNSYVNIDSATGNLSFNGTAGYRVANNRFAFIAAGAPSAGLFFNATNTRYEFRSTIGVSVLNIGADANGRIGIGNTSPAAKLDINGNIKITDGTQGAGKVLTSDASGLASWQIPAAGGSSWTVSGSNIYNSNIGNVGIGNSASAAKLDVAGSGWFRTDQGSLPSAAGTGVRVFFDQPSDAGSIFAYDYNAGAPKPLMLQNPGGNVGIGTSAPSNKLDVGAYYNDNDTYVGIKTSGGNVHKAGIKLRHFNDDYGFDIISDETVNGFFINHHFADSAGVNVFTIDGNNNVGIGTTTPSVGYKLTVAGKIICTELKVQLQPFPDYVFDKNYKLRSIAEVEDHIKNFNRLPGMPAASEIEKNGMSVGEMQGKVVEKVEENTLYIIQLSKENEALKKQLQAQAKAIADLRAAVEALKK